MKVLLIRPHITLEVAQKLRSFLHLEPLALEIVAGGIGERHDVRILDLACRPDPLSAFRGMLGSFEPDVVGFTGYSNQAETVKQLARECRGLLPDALIMVGGIHATVVPEDYGRCDAIDLVVRGEGGTAIRRFFRTFETKGTIPEDDALLPVRSPDFAQRCRSRPPQLPPYEEIPRARRDLVDRSRYFCVWHGKKREHLPTLFPRTAAMRTSWGCPNRCNFCVVHYLADGKYRQRSPESTVEAIDSIPEEHIYFVDDEMFINARRCRAIAELLIERDIDKQYVSWARADTICRHPELFALWKKAGLSLLYVGLESMDADALEGFNKGIKPGVNRKAVRILKSLGIGLHAAFMVRPEFEDEDFGGLRSAVEEVSPAEVTFTVFSPSPGTPLWEQHRDDFICEDPYSFYDCFHTLLPTSLPLKEFYAKFAGLYLHGVRHNPWLHNRVRVPVGDFCRFVWSGVRYGLSLRNIYRDYQ